VRAICLDDTGGGSRWTLAAVGANARRASEDSTTVGYIGEPDAAAARFSRPILESAGIAQLSGVPGATAMSRLLEAIRRAPDDASLRESVDEEIGAADS
jgi:branched-chain amino acid transport system substrate-binding protein